MLGKAAQCALYGFHTRACFPHAHGCPLNTPPPHPPPHTPPHTRRRFDKAVPGPAASGAGMDAVKGLGEKVSALVEQYIAGG